MYKLYCKYRDKKGYKDSDVAKKTGITKSTFSDWKNGRSKPSTDKLLKIADALDLSIEYLTESDSTITTCYDCGLTYDINSKEDFNYHKQNHELYEKAIKKYGDLYCNYAINEKIKAKNRNIVYDFSLSLDERYNAQLEVFRCLFSRSVSYNNYSLKHVDFNSYTAMLLNDDTLEKRIGKELYNMLVSKFGKKDGIPSGKTYYEIPYEDSTIAAHFDGDEYTEEELDEIKQFAEFVKSKRK